MKTLFKFILLTGLRDKLYLGLLLIIFCIFGLSNLVGFSAISEQSQMQLVYFSFLSRLVIVCGLILFICFYVHRSFENKEIDFILAKSISRVKFISSYWLSFNLISIILIIPVILIQIIFNHPNLIGLMWWSISIILEIMLISTFAIVSSLILKSAVVSVLASISFYFITRMMGFFVYSISIPNKTEQLKNFDGISEGLLKVLSTIFPRLDLFAKSEWLVYGVTNYQDIYIVLIQSIIYIPLMLFLAFYDFEKKQF